MSNEDLGFMTLKDAATLLDKSVRTLKRYLGDMDKGDKNRLSCLSKGRVMVNSEFIDLAKKNNLPKKKAQSKVDPVETIKGEYIDRIVSLETKNKELFEIIKKKDGQLEEKDKLIKENLNDFKMLTSKVLFLQEEKLELQKPIEDKKGKEFEVVPNAPSLSDSLLLFLAVGFVGLIAAIGYLLLA